MVAPGRFSTITCCPIWSERVCAITHDARSVGPPDGKATMRRMGLLGYLGCACTSPDTATPAIRLATAMQGRLLTGMVVLLRLEISIRSRRISLRVAREQALGGIAHHAFVALVRYDP